MKRRDFFKFSVIGAAAVPVILKKGEPKPVIEAAPMMAYSNADCPEGMICVNGVCIRPRRTTYQKN